MIRRIRDLLYDQGFTISGARNKLQELVQSERDQRRSGEVLLDGIELLEAGDSVLDDFVDSADLADSMRSQVNSPAANSAHQRLELMRRELCEIRDLLGPGL